MIREDEIRTGAQRWFAPGPFRAFVSCAATLILLTAVAAATLADPNPNGARSKLSVARHGFNFVNYFEADLVANLPIFGKVNLGRKPFGMCMGMPYAADDSYFHESTTGNRTCSPRQSGGRWDPPKQGSPLFAYLWDRQMDALRRNNWEAVRKLADWMKKPLDDRYINVGGYKRRATKGLKTLSWEEFTRKIAPRIDKGWAVPLLLVRTVWGQGSLEDMFSQNHGMLAIGYRLHDLGGGEKEWDIIAYDPNTPGEEVVIHRDSRTITTMSGSQTGVSDFRGFFVTPYRGQKPYWAPAEPRPLGTDPNCPPLPRLRAPLRLGD